MRPGVLTEVLGGLFQKEPPWSFQFARRSSLDDGKNPKCVHSINHVFYSWLCCISDASTPGTFVTLQGLPLLPRESKRLTCE